MKTLLAALLLPVLVLAACKSGVDLDATPELRLNEDVCQECGMIISDARFSAAYRLRDGGQKVFDDIGDMVAHHRIHADDVAVFWVHDYDTLEWMRAEDAYFAASNNLVTPMGHGIAAFSTSGAAAAMAQSLGGVVYRFDELLASSIWELDKGE